MITVPGRVLVPPTVKYRGSKSINTRNGSWNMQGVKFTAGATVPPWTYLWMKRPHKDGPIARNGQLPIILEEFQKMMNASGLTAPKALRSMELLLDSAGRPNDDAIDAFFQKASVNQPKYGLVFVILPDTDAAIYNAVKYAGDIKYGIHTVCVVEQKVAKPERRDQYLANVALKVNSKLNGINQALDPQK